MLSKTATGKHRSNFRAHKASSEQRRFSIMKMTGMKTGARLATILVALAIFGCKGSVQSSSASAADGSGGGSSSGDGAASSSSGGGFGSATQVDYIKDPSLGMNAISVTIPANCFSRVAPVLQLRSACFAR